jgi:hypothetical protein
MGQRRTPPLFQDGFAVPQNGFVRPVFQPFLPDFRQVFRREGRSNPRDNREVLVSLTKAGLAAHDAIVAGGQERNRRLLAELREAEIEMLLGQIDRLTEKAARMLADEKGST